MNIEEILNQIITIYNPISTEFYNLFSKLCSNTKEDTILFLEGKSIYFRYLEYLLKIDQLKNLNVQKCFNDTNIIIITEMLVKNNLDVAKTYNEFANQTNLYPYIDKYRLINTLIVVLNHKIKELTNKNFSNRHIYINYIMLKFYMTTALVNETYHDIYDDEELIERFCNIFIKMNDDDKLENVKWLTPKMYDKLLSNGVDLSTVTTTKDKKSLLICAMINNNFDLIKHLVYKHNYNIYYRDALNKNAIDYTTYGFRCEMKDMTEKYCGEINYENVCCPQYTEIEILQFKNIQLQETIAELQTKNKSLQDKIDNYEQSIKNDYEIIKQKYHDITKSFN